MAVLTPPLFTGCNSSGPASDVGDADREPQQRLAVAALGDVDAVGRDRHQIGILWGACQDRAGEKRAADGGGHEFPHVGWSALWIGCWTGPKPPRREKLTPPQQVAVSVQGYSSAIIIPITVDGEVSIDEQLALV